MLFLVDLPFLKKFWPATVSNIFLLHIPAFLFILSVFIRPTTWLSDFPFDDSCPDLLRPCSADVPNESSYRYCGIQPNYREACNWLAPEDRAMARDVH